jgi:hypothetical protein
MIDYEWGLCVVIMQLAKGPARTSKFVVVGCILGFCAKSRSPGSMQ